jgi:hypothetical protein
MLHRSLLFNGTSGASCKQTARELQTLEATQRRASEDLIGLRVITLSGRLSSTDTEMHVATEERFFGSSIGKLRKFWKLQASMILDTWNE